MKTKYFIILLVTIFLPSCNTKKEVVSALNYDSLKIVLEQMVFQDQDIRRILIDSVGLGSPNAGPYMKKMMDVDNANQEKLKVILNKYGWIEQSKIGTKAAEAFFYIIQHSDTTLMIKWFPVFQQLANKGEADKVECAMMEDRLLMWRGKKQIYGSQASTFRPDKKMAIWPIEDPEHVNERRRKIGFAMTVEKNAERLEAIYDSRDTLPVKK